MNKISKKLTPTIGLEIHVELSTESKMFCGCVNKHFSVKPNTHTCPVCLGLPGALPVPNKKAIEHTIMIASAFNCKINEESKFDRKHYFYPDLPKAYQISQYDEPLSEKGHLDTKEGRIGIIRVHLEEDTGKLVHKKVDGKEATLVDFNRSGVPLVEIVTEPDMKSGKQAKDFARKLRKVIRFLGVSDCDMEKGSMRIEANISQGQHLGYKVEVKNLNSFRFAERAIDYELLRQKKLLAKGIIPKQETRGWSETKNKTVTQRYKETEADYRYFPEPDIPPMYFSDSEINKIKDSLPELPSKIKERLLKTYNLPPHYVDVILGSKELLAFSEKSFKLAARDKIAVKEVASTIVNQKLDISKSSPEELIKNLKKLKTSRVTDTKKIESWAKEAIKLMPDAVRDYKSGKEAAFSAVIGKAMQLSYGKADPAIIRKILEKKLGK
jgi:aspartyl-tRNA(Asn)/glutamyl-tRNA(Gln) amidotransferase subunit B